LKIPTPAFVTFILHCVVLYRPLQLTVTKIDLAKDNDKVEVVDGGASRASGKTIATLSALDNYKDKGLFPHI